MNKIFALVDCDNFYASCERAFNPSLANRPVIVLSNNDGCVIARSNEVKQMKVPLGEPYFKCRDLVEKHNIAVFSSNYELYGDMSRRVMEILAGFALDIEIYSIDEAFLELDGFRHQNLDEYAAEIRRYVLQGTGLPVTIGIGSSKTLAKVASKYAKKNRQSGAVFNIVNHPDIDHLLEGIPVEDIWGVGRQYDKFLRRHGIENARQLKYAQDKWVKKHMTVVGLRTVWELRGKSCLELDQAPAPKKGICTSRSFGRPIETLAEMREAIAEYASRAAEKCRQQHSAASIMQVFLTTNRFKEEPQYFNCIQIVLPTPTNDTLELVRYACRGIEKIYRPNYHYKKAGIFLTDIVDSDNIQLNLFDNYPYREKSQKLMRVMDQLNSRYGSKTVQVAAAGTRKEWAMQRNMKSNNFTTNWNEILIVKA
ncbi:MAG TPA: Y-family DNA polymerase [bacterium]|nr:Y-family DNA polymerase [bacterium]HPN44157.1 Y-family DNA polymerase [bacterium]